MCCLRIIKYILLILFLFLFLISAISAEVKLKGEILSEVEKKPVEFGTLLILEEKKKISFKNGRFSVEVEKAGFFTFKISAPGFSTLEKKVEILKEQNLTFYLPPATFRTKSLKVRDRLAIQKLSRNTLDQREIKNVPATFGDSLNALSSLPGVIRPTRFFGNLLIRGANETANRYFIDQIPVLYPQHFGGLQSVISNELIDRIDLYSSAFPAYFTQAQGAVIDITTKDTVRDFNSKLTISLLSADFYFEGMLSPLIIVPENKIGINETEPEEKKRSEILKNKNNETILLQSEKRKNRGYWIISGRVSYLTTTLSPIINALSSDDNDEFQLPQYYDYQVKGKYFLDRRGYHSISLLFFGFYDTFKFIRSEPEESDIQDAIESGEDPLFASSPSDINNTIFSNNIGFYYRFSPSVRINNLSVAFAALNQSKFFADIEALADFGLNPKTLDINIRPDIYGLKNLTEIAWLEETGFLKFGLEYRLYSFRSNGVTQTLTDPTITGPPDFGIDSLFRRVEIDFSETNTTFSSFLENTFGIYDFTVVTGIHLAYLNLNQAFTYDPRFLLSYEFDWELTISAGYGYYSSFPQVNYFLFNIPFNQQPTIARAKYIDPERSRHLSVGIEQIFPILSVKVEGFYNTFSNQLINNPDTNSEFIFINSAEIRSTGFELFLRLNKAKRQDTFYGWLSYTYTSSLKNNNVDIPDNIYGRQYLSSEFEQPHSLKWVMGYIFGKNNIGLRFELNSGFPYTPITGGENNEIQGITRYSPVYGKPFSKRFPIDHRLDIRYTRTSVYSWGSIDWYVEIINVYFNRAIAQQNWNYNLPFQEGVNPVLGKSPLSIIIPNFGVEIRF